MRFSEIYDNHYDWVFGYVLVKVHNRQDAEDVTQEVFFNLWKSLERNAIEEIENLDAWITTIAKGEIIARHRRLTAQKRGIRVSDDEAVILFDEAVDVTLPPIEETVIRRDLEEKITAMLKNHNPNYLKVWRLCYLESHSITEAAERLGCTRESARNWWWRSNTKVREYLTRLEVRA